MPARPQPDGFRDRRVGLRARGSADIMTTLPTVPADPGSPRIYDRAFWLAYTANLLLVVANALTFRFAEFVQFLGGTESVTGEIVRVGLIGSLLARLFLGQALDGLGVRRVWIVSSLVFVIGTSLFVFCRELGPLLFVARVLFTIGIASMFACSILHIQNRVPAHRRTEVIGSLGSSGFVGMITGAHLGDLLFHTVSDQQILFMVLFALTAGLGAAYLGIVTWLTRADGLPAPTPAPPIHQLIFRYWPGPVVLVALMMGLSFTVSTVFLTRYATSLQLSGIGMFFTGYAVSAFCFRLLSRNWSQTIGRHKMILLGLTGHTIGQLLLLPVQSDWGLIAPSVCAGFGHALLFPCVISLGSGAFPPAFRGTGTAITLGFVDLGVMLSAPILGGVIEQSGFSPVFLISAGLMFATTLVYAALTFRVPDAEALSTARSLEEPAAESECVTPTSDAPCPAEPVGALSQSAEPSRSIGNPKLH